MTNRTRNVRLEIKLTEEEKELFEKKRKMSHCKSMNQFLRKVVSEADIFIIDLQPFREIQGLLSRYASSINQIAKRVNSTGVIYRDDIKCIKKNTLIICSEYSYLVIFDTILFYFISTIVLSTKAFFVSSSSKSSNIPLPSPVLSNKACPLYISISCENQQSCFTKHNS